MSASLYIYVFCSYTWLQDHICMSFAHTCGYELAYACLLLIHVVTSSHMHVFCSSRGYELTYACLLLIHVVTRSHMHICCLCMWLQGHICMSFAHTCGYELTYACLLLITWLRAHICMSFAHHVVANWLLAHSLIVKLKRNFIYIYIYSLLCIDSLTTYSLNLQANILYTKHSNL